MKKKFNSEFCKMCFFIFPVGSCWSEPACTSTSTRRSTARSTTIRRSTILFSVRCEELYSTDSGDYSKCQIRKGHVKLSRPASGLKNFHWFNASSTSTCKILLRCNHIYAKKEHNLHLPQVDHLLYNQRQQVDQTLKLQTELGMQVDILINF